MKVRRKSVPGGWTGVEETVFSNLVLVLAERKPQTVDLSRYLSLAAVTVDTHSDKCCDIDVERFGVWSTVLVHVGVPGRQWMAG